MRRTSLASNGPDVGVIGLGCMGMTASYDLETPRDDATSIAVIHQALDLGMTLIDTADAYGPYTNEELVGRALAGGHRERAVLATKVGLTDDTPASATTTGTASPGKGRDGRPEHVRRSIDESLRRLGTDHVDLYQLHRVDPAVPLEETWGAMAETVTAGKAGSSVCRRFRLPRSASHSRCMPSRRCSPSCRCGHATCWRRCCRIASSRTSR